MMYNLFQMVDRLDDGTIPADLGPLDYKGLYKVIAEVFVNIIYG